MSDCTDLKDFDFSKIGETFKNVDLNDFTHNMDILPKIPAHIYEPVKIDPKSTVQYQIKEQTKLLTEQSLKQIETLNEQNKRLALLIEQRDKEIEENKEELKKSTRLNIAMFIVTIISMLVAVAAWLTPLITGGAA